MKRAVRIIFVILILILLSPLSFRAFASQEQEERAEVGEYLITMSGGEYLLSVRSGNDYSPVTSSAMLSSVIEYLNTSGGGRVVFGGISADEEIVLTEDYVISGSLTHKKGIVISDANVTFSDLSLTVIDKPVRIKSGTLTLLDGEISATDSSAFVLDFSNGASLNISGGRVISDSKLPTVSIDFGTVNVSGGIIENKGGTAIVNRATLMLSGSCEIYGRDYGASTTVPLFLAGASNSISTSLKVKYEDEFQKGSISSVFYNGSEESTSKITLYDKHGEQMPIKYFASHERLSEKNTVAVYMPYTYSYYSDEKLVFVEKLLNGELSSGYGDIEKTGYKHIGWSVDKALGPLFDFQLGASSDLNLYASYSLSAPTFSLSSLEFTYDKTERFLSVQALSHPLLDSATVSCIWYRGEEELSYTGMGLSIKNVSDSGEYKCKVIFTYGKDSVAVVSPFVSVKVNKAVVDVKAPQPKVYNGQAQAPEIYSTAIYKVSSNGGTLAGIYPVSVTLFDSENYRFKTVEGDTLYLDFEILVADNYFVDSIQISNIYECFKPNPSATSRFGTPVFLYSTDIDGPFTESVPTAVGKYYVRAYVSESENYRQLYSEPVAFEIYEEVIVGASIHKMPYKCDYTSFESFVPDGLVISVSYNSSRTELVGSELLSFSYQENDCFRFGDSTVIAKYLDTTVSVPVSVSKAKYDISGIAFISSQLVYNGYVQTLSYSGILPTGLDGIPLRATVVGGGADVGTYTVTLLFESDSVEYYIPESIRATLTVLPFEAECIWADTTFVYDGQVKSPTAYYVDVFGRKVYLSVSGERSLAGKYTAVALTPDSSYKLINEKQEYEILKADYDFSAILWSDGNFVYNGEEREVLLTNLPDGVSVLVYTNNKGTQAGKYVAGVSLSYDTLNYNPPPKITYEWQIKRAEYDISGFVFSDTVAEYNGSVQYPLIKGEMPTGLDGIALQYAFSRGATHVSEGRVLVDISFNTKSVNYVCPENISVYIEIIPKGINVEWNGLEFTYDTTSHLPSASAQQCQVKVLGSQVGAGIYTATAVSLNSDYYVVNKNVSFEIKKTRNAWTQPLRIESIFENRELTPTASVLGGTVEYIYSSDKEGKVKIDTPTASGKYYVFAYSKGDENYLEISSQPIEFEIYKILPTDILLSLNKLKFSAFDTLTEGDITVTVLNNDGSTYILDFNAVSVVYQNGTSMRFGDKAVTISAVGIERNIEIEVEKADYDTSGVSWGESEFYYDKTEKSLTLLGLPDGITVLYYEGGVGTLVGEYPVRAVIEYDSENYNPPAIPVGKLIIKKQIVTPHGVEALIYNGTQQTPTVTESELYSFEIEKGTKAGKYKIVYTLHDTENYELKTSIAFYEILPREIDVVLSDVHKYLFEDICEPSYTVTDGEIVEGDNLMLQFIYGSDSVSCIAQNPNYKLNVTDARVIHIGRLSDEGVARAFGGFLILICLLLLILAVVVRRHQIIRYVLTVKSRVAPVSKDKSEESAVIPEQPKALPPPSCVTEPSTSEADTPRADTEINQEEAISENTIENVLSVDVAHADSLITNSLAKSLLRRGEDVVVTDGTRKRIVNVDTISRSFSSGETVDVNALKKREILPRDTAYIKVLARGSIDKPLRILANDFSLSAVKMIALTGGEAIRVVTKKSDGENS